MLTSRRIGRTRVTPLRAPTPSAGTQAAAPGCGVTPQTQARDGSTAQYRSALKVYLHLTYNCHTGYEQHMTVDNYNL